MIGAVHNEGHIRGDHAKLSDDQLVADKIEMVFHIFFKIPHILKIVIVGVIADDDIRTGDDVFQKTKAIVSGKREWLIFIGSRHREESLLILILAEDREKWWSLPEGLSALGMF
jgi:hypothetical protein